VSDQAPDYQALAEWMDERRAAVFSHICASRPKAHSSAQSSAFSQP
jgi:hypothetical protein